MTKLKSLIVPVLAALLAAGIAAFAANISVDDIIASGATATVSSCGTGTPTISGSDTAGVVTTGNNASGCTITFSGTKAAAPKCVVTWGTNIAAMAYAVSTTAITIVDTAGTAKKIFYACFQ